MTISLDKLGDPGVQGELIVQAMFTDRDNDDPLRLNDQSTRNFELKSKLSKQPPDSYDMNSAFGPSDGSSFIIAPQGSYYLELQLFDGLIRLDINSLREISMASATITAANAREARIKFLTTLSHYLDRMSYLTRAPTHISLTVARDVNHEVQYITCFGPPRAAEINSGGEELSADMQPIYALYREAMNSNSPYYRVLCFHKIMEGLLGSLRTAVRKRAKALLIELPIVKDRVPDHIDFPMGLKHLVGKSAKDFFDNFMTRQYRDAMAHFTLKQGSTLNVSSPVYYSRFVDVAFVSDLCARNIIQSHEKNLRMVIECERRASQVIP